RPADQLLGTVHERHAPPVRRPVPLADQPLGPPGPGAAGPAAGPERPAAAPPGSAGLDAGGGSTPPPPLRRPRPPASRARRRALPPLGRLAGDRRRARPGPDHRPAADGRLLEPLPRHPGAHGPAGGPGRPAAVRRRVRGRRPRPDPQRDAPPLALVAAAAGPG